MATIASVITDIRYEMNDAQSARFSDTTILAIMKKTIRRANRILQRNGIQFAKKYADTATTANQAYIAMPADFDVDIGLYISATRDELKKLTERDWEKMNADSACEYYLLDYVNSRIWLKDTPSDASTTLRLWYYPTCDPSAYVVGTSMPWSDRLNDIIAEYTALRLKNIDEMDATFDQSLLTDMENQILGAYQPLAPTMVSGDGWL